MPNVSTHHAPGGSAAPIDLSQHAQVRYWSEMLSVTKSELAEMVHKVGPSPEAVWKAVESTRPH
jgi:hypothetical protein